MKVYTEKVIAVVDHVEQGIASNQTAWEAVRLSTNEFLGKRKLTPEQCIQLKEMKKIYHAHRSENYPKLWAMGKTLLRFADDDIDDKVIDKFYWECR